LGIEGVVRVTYHAGTTRLDTGMLEASFPRQAEACRVNELAGSFLWRSVARPSDFAEERLAAEEATKRAEQAASDVLVASAPLDGVLARTDEIERQHERFLWETQVVSRLENDLADLRCDLTVRLGSDFAIHRICSFKRVARARVDVDAFCTAYPREAEQCMQPVAAQLRKFVYPTRSYL
jgi:hypothetical protein